MQDFITKCFENKQVASRLNKKYMPFFEKLFIQTNPLPAKTFLAEKKIIKEKFRIPLCPMDEKEKKEFLELVKKYDF